MQVILTKGKQPELRNRTVRHIRFSSASGKAVFYGVTHMEKITCTVNGQETAFAEGSTMEDVVRSLGADPAKVVVERNAVIVPREKFAAVEAGEGDVIEVVQFVGGG